MADKDVKMVISGDAAPLAASAKEAAEELADLTREANRAGEGTADAGRRGEQGLDGLKDAAEKVGGEFGSLGRVGVAALEGFSSPAALAATAIGAIVAAVGSLEASLERSIALTKEFAEAAQQAVATPEVAALLEARGAFGPGAQGRVTEEVLATAESRGQDYRQVAAIKDQMDRLKAAGVIAPEEAGGIENQALRWAALHGGAGGTRQAIELMTQFGLRDQAGVAGGFAGISAAAGAAGMQEEQILQLLAGASPKGKKLGMGFPEMTAITARYAKEYRSEASGQLTQALEAMTQMTPEVEGKLGGLGIRTQPEFLLQDLRGRLGGKSLEEQRKALIAIFGSKRGTALLPMLRAPDAEMARQLAEQPDFAAEEAARRQEPGSLMARGEAATIAAKSATALADTITKSIVDAGERAGQVFAKEHPGEAAVPTRVSHAEYEGQKDAIRRQAAELIPQLTGETELVGQITQRIKDLDNPRIPVSTGTVRAVAELFARARYTIARKRTERSEAERAAAGPATAPAMAAPAITSTAELDARAQQYATQQSAAAGQKGLGEKVAGDIMEWANAQYKRDQDAGAFSAWSAMAERAKTDPEFAQQIAQEAWQRAATLEPPKPHKLTAAEEEAVRKIRLAQTRAKQQAERTGDWTTAEELDELEAAVRADRTPESLDRQLAGVQVHGGRGARQWVDPVSIINIGTAFIDRHRDPRENARPPRAQDLGRP